MNVNSVISPFLDEHGVLILDGGFATELEKHGCDLNNTLWSASVLQKSPKVIRAVHDSYLESGADCIASASYQATPQGFAGIGLSENESERLIRLSASLAEEARNSFHKRHPERLKPIVGASIGPYGAYLSDGSEYTGSYSLSRTELATFHEPRWSILADSPSDFMACETIPSLKEAEALVDLLSGTPERTATISFSCRDGHHISDGTPIRECASLLEGVEQVVAVGVNCMAPHLTTSLVQNLAEELNDTEIMVYPNSGEVFDASSKTWSGMENLDACATAAQEWYSHGARIIGGCCRTGPEHIGAMRKHLI